MGNKIGCILLCSLSVLFISCYPSNVTKKNSVDIPAKPVEFTLIDSLDKTKEELYVKAYEWMAKTFVSAKAVIQMQDKKAGKLIGKGVFDVLGEKDIMKVEITSDVCYYTISIDTKNNKYRCKLTNFIHEGGTATTIFGGDPYYSPSLGNLNAPPSKKNLKRHDAIKNEVTIQAQDLLTSLRQFMHDDSNDF